MLGHTAIDVSKSPARLCIKAEGKYGAIHIWEKTLETLGVDYFGTLTHWHTLLAPATRSGSGRCPDARLSSDGREADLNDATRRLVMYVLPEAHFQLGRPREAAQLSTRRRHR